MPLRIATTAWPSSWSTIEKKKRKALSTASPNALASLPGERSAKYPDISQMTRNSTKNQLGSTPMRTPNTRAS